MKAHAHKLCLLFFSFIVCVPTLSFSRPEPQKTDFGQVAYYVSYLLQLHHFSRQPIDDAFSKKLLDNYLSQLDPAKLYFTQKNVDHFHKEYATELDNMLRRSDLSAVIHIYNTYRDHIEKRLKKIKTLLDQNTFDFTKEEYIQLSRKEAPWPANELEADTLWKNQIKQELLQELLQNEDPDPDEKEKKKEEDKVKKDPKEEILKSYQHRYKQQQEESEEAICGEFLRALSMTFDPHSYYFDKKEWGQFSSDMKKQFFGIGAQLGIDEEFAVIKGIVKGGPAALQGELQIGDKILGVGQGNAGEIIDTRYMTLTRIVNMIRGEKGSLVRLELKRPSEDDPVTIDIVRDTVQIQNSRASARLIELQTASEKKLRLGWIILPGFYYDLDNGTRSATEDVQNLLLRLKKEHIDGLILDLRLNGGGSLEEAIKMTGLFIPKGPVVQSKDYRGRINWRASQNVEPAYEGPLLIFTDRVSASASEILAAALQDYNRAVILGEKSTFGKGTVQTILDVSSIMPLFSARENAGHLKVTIQKFYRIAGGSTQLKGVVPDIILPSPRDVSEIGEEFLESPLPYDEIKKRPFTRFDQKNLHLEELRKRSQQRIAQNQDFLYLKEDTARFEEQIKKNQLSLNKEQRLKERAENRERNKTRKEERKARYAETKAKLKDTLKHYALTLSMLENPKLKLYSDATDEELTGMQLEKKDDDDALTYPFNISPYEYEALLVLSDLVTL